MMFFACCASTAGAYVRKVSSSINLYLRKNNRFLCLRHFNELLDDDLKASPHLLTAGYDLARGQHKTVSKARTL
jgi:hypothetical protein